MKEDEIGLEDLLCWALLDYLSEPTQDEIDKFMNDDTPLSSEEQAMLDKMGENLPSMIKEWRAKDEGCLVVQDERTD